MIIAGFWTLFGLISGIQVWISMMTHGHSVPRLIAYHIAIWEAWLGITAVVVWVTRRWPFIPVTAGNLLRHLTAAFLLGSVHIVYWMILMLTVRPYGPRTADFADMDLGEIFASRVPLELIFYCAVVSSAQAADYYVKYRERALRAAQLEVSLTNARLHALELQIQPHFLFNTLNAISSLVRTTRNDEAVVMIAGLSDLLRYTLDHAEEQRVSLEEESAMLQRYLDIQRVRFADRMSFSIDIDADVRRAAVPTLILQPLAENAIRHGVAMSAGSGLVTVRAFRNDGDLQIDIFNTGNLRENADQGIGLTNTMERLRQLYGEGKHFDLRNLRGGVMASLTIPCTEIP